MLTEIRILVSVAIDQAHEAIHRLRLRHSYSYRVAWVQTMREFKAECRVNDALARELTYGRAQDDALTAALLQVTYANLYRDAR